MEYDNKLKDFSDIVLREASEEKQQILAMVKKQIHEANSHTKNEIIKKAEENLKVETEIRVRKKNEVVSKNAMEVRKILIEKREELIEQMHNAVNGRLINFTQSTEYLDWMIEQIKDAQNQLKDKKVIVHICKADEKFTADIINKLNVKVLIDDEITFGGCKIISEVKKMLVDSTLQKKLDEAFSNFYMLAIRN